MLEQRGDYAYDYILHEADTPTTMQWHFLGQSNLPVAVQSWELPPGGTEGMHSHDESGLPKDEIYIVTEGLGRMKVGDHTYDLQPGDAVLAAAGIPHDLVNTGNEPLRLIVVWGYHGHADYSHFGVTKAAQERRTNSY